MMFDTYRIKRGPEFVSVDITEKRAPTDESVRLLREMEEAVEKRMLAAVRVNDTAFQCVVRMRDDHMMGDKVLMAIFSVNGKKMTATYTIPYIGGDFETAVTGLRDEVAKVIANHIAGAFDKSLAYQLRG
jgi:hypothetical protein